MQIGEITIEPYVTNKKICLVRIVLFMCMALYYLFARLLIEKKDLFSRNWTCCKYAFIKS